MAFSIDDQKRAIDNHYSQFVKDLELVISDNDVGINDRKTSLSLMNDYLRIFQTFCRATIPFSEHREVVRYANEMDKRAVHLTISLRNRLR